MMKKLLFVILSLMLIQSCQLIFNSGGDLEDDTGDNFSRLAKLEGEWEVLSEVQIAFELFEQSEAEAEIDADHDGRILSENFEGYIKDDKWTINTQYKLIAEDSLEVRVSDSRDTTNELYYGTFIEGFLSVVTPEGDKKLEMRLFEDRLLKKIYQATPTEDANWQLIRYAEYERD